MKQVLVIERLNRESLAMLDRRPDISWTLTEDTEPDALSDQIKGVAALTVRVSMLPTELLDQAPELKVISRHGVGYDNVPVEYCTERGIAVTITGTANSTSVAEQTMYLMLAAAKAGIEDDNAIRTGKYHLRSKQNRLELAGRNLFIVGLGRIGKEVLIRARAFGMHPIVFDPFVNASENQEVECVSSLHAALPRADVISLHLPLTPESRHLIGAREIAMLPGKAIIVNASRGGLVDEEALLEGIRSGAIAAAGLDTFEQEPLPVNSPLVSERRIVLSPHSAALTEESLAEMARVTVQNVLDGIDGSLDPNLVVNPEVLDRPQ